MESETVSRKTWEAQTKLSVQTQPLNYNYSSTEKLFKTRLRTLLVCNLPLCGFEIVS